MKLSTFLARNVNSAATVKIVFPEKNKIATGRPMDFAMETAMMNANVFDFQITDPEAGYNVLVWITRQNLTMLEV